MNINTGDYCSRFLNLRNICLFVLSEEAEGKRPRQEIYKLKYRKNILHSR